MVNEESVLCASLPSLCLSKVENGDPKEVVRLHRACLENGFFYLDLTKDQTLIDDHQSLLDVMRQYFDQSSDVKMKDDHKSDNTG